MEREGAGGTYTTGFYNAELMINGYEDQQYKAIIIHAVDKFPPNLRMKVVYEDDSVDDPAIPGFRKTARVSFSKKYKYVSIIAPSATKFTMDIDYVECVPFTELDENSAFPSSFKEQEQGSFILKRSFSKGWNSLFVPFYIPYNKFIENFGEDTKAFKFAGYEDGHVKFEKVVANYEWDYVVDCWRPYLVYISDENVPAVTDKQIVIADTYIGMGGELLTLSHTINGSAFVGIWAPASSEDLAGKYCVTNDGYVRKLGSSATCLGYRGYLILNEPSGSKPMSLMIDGVATGITQAQGEVSAPANGILYNLNGQRVNSNYKGVVVVNGKKAIKR